MNDKEKEMDVFEIIANAIQGLGKVSTNLLDRIKVLEDKIQFMENKDKE